MNFSIKLSISILLFQLQNLSAHPGQLNAEGCHKENKTKSYHCHEEKTVQKALDNKNDDNKTGIIQIDYTGFTIWLDCEKHAAVRFRYNAQKDTGNLNRAEEFKLDPKIPSNCQQKTSRAYGNNFDRGHLVPANHLDYSKIAITESNFMTNILPQHKNMNRGAWLQTEEIIECYRDIDELLVYGGAIWDEKKKNNDFVNSHGIETPNAFWKLILRGQPGAEKINAWIIPNDDTATMKKLDEFLVAPEQIEKRIGEKLPIPEYLRTEKPSTSWIIPMHCNKS